MHDDHLLDDLRRLRGLQLLQRQALLDADGERLDALDRERMDLQARLVPLRDAGLHGADLDEARGLGRLIQDGQRDLIDLALATRERLAAELAALAPGRAALSSYRAPVVTNSRYLDSVG